MSAGPVSAIECLEKRAVKVTSLPLLSICNVYSVCWPLQLNKMYMGPLYTLQVIGDRDGKTWKARLSLQKVECDANQFMSSLAAHLHDSHAFCQAVSDATGGVVEYGSSGSSSVNVPSPIAEVKETDRA